MAIQNAPSQGIVIPADQGYDIKKDLYGTSETLGVIDTRMDRATRRLLVSGMHETHEAGLVFGQIIQPDSEYLTHPRNENLPLSKATATKFGPTKAMVTLEYSRPRWGSIPQVPPKVMAKVRTDVYASPFVQTSYTWDPGPPLVQVEAWTNGRPNGIDYKDSDGKIAEYTWTRPCLKLYVPTVLLESPVSGCADIVNYVNNGPVYYSGHTFPQGTVRFDGLTVDWSLRAYNGESQNWFTVMYAFTILVDGFATQQIEWDDDLSPPAAIRGPITRPRQTNFTADGVFPVHYE